MIYKLLVRFADDFTLFNVFRYITFRSVASFLTSFLVVWLVGKPFIARIQRMQFGQQVRDDGPQSHKKKQGTPTLGGILILLGVFASALLWADLANPLVIGTLFITLAFGTIGFMDDYLKISKKNTKGLSGKIRLVLEFAIVGIVLGCLIHFEHFNTELSVPFFKEFRPDLNWFYVLFASFVTVGCANAVNLTDGLDGLAIVPVVLASFALGVFAYVHGHSEIARYLQLHAVQGAGELTPLAAAMIGAGMGFLWYNSYPAQIFMGDVGSLSLGGFIGSLAVFTKNEILLILVGGVFVVEALSVITQVASFKLTGKRIFKMAPIHHHFELTGVQEPKVIIRFWIVSILLAVLSLSTLKLR